MGSKTFDIVLHLVCLGYSVKFSKATDFLPAQVLRIELSKKDNHHVELVDMSLKNVPWAVNSDDLIARHLERAQWEFEYEFEKEANK
jgi:hypothetical protein